MFAQIYGWEDMFLSCTVLCYMKSGIVTVNERLQCYHQKLWGGDNSNLSIPISAPVGIRARSWHSLCQVWQRTSWGIEWMKLGLIKRYDCHFVFCQYLVLSDSKCRQINMCLWGAREVASVLLGLQCAQAELWKVKSSILTMHFKQD